MRPPRPKALPQSAAKEPSVVHHQHSWLDRAQQVMSSMGLATCVGTETAIHDGVAPTLHQAHAADLRIGSFAVLIVRASKCRVIEGRIRDVKECAINGH